MGTPVHFRKARRKLLVSEYPRDRATSSIEMLDSTSRARARASRNRSLTSRKELLSAFKDRCSLRGPMKSRPDTASSDRSPSANCVRSASVTTSCIVCGCVTPSSNGRSLNMTTSSGAGGVGFGTSTSDVRIARAGIWAPLRTGAPTKSSKRPTLAPFFPVISIQSGCQAGPRKCRAA